MRIREPLIKLRHTLTFLAFTSCYLCEGSVHLVRADVELGPGACYMLPVQVAQVSGLDIRCICCANPIPGTWYLVHVQYQNLEEADKLKRRERKGR